MSKAHVVPQKTVTILRLELQAAVTSTQIGSLAWRELGLQASETFRADSQVVLGYIGNSSKKFHVYIANQVQQIRDHSPPEQWFYVPTDINPAR